MRVYELRADGDTYEYVDFELEDIPDEKFWPDYPRRLADTWEPLTVRLHRQDPTGKPLLPGDFPALLPGVPVFSRRAVDALRDLLEPHGEILPLLCEEGDYFLYNVIRVIDALDLARCEIPRYPDGSLAKYVESYAFKPELVRDALIFKVPNFRHSEVFVTDRLVERVEQNGLRGFDFEPLWSSAPEFTDR